MYSENAFLELIFYKQWEPERYKMCPYFAKCLSTGTPSLSSGAARVGRISGRIISYYPAGYCVGRVKYPTGYYIYKRAGYPVVQSVLWSRSRTFLLEPEPVKMLRLQPVSNKCTVVGNIFLNQFPRGLHIGTYTYTMYIKIIKNSLYTNK